MSTALRIAGFLAALAAVFGIALGVGNTVGPVAPEPEKKTAHEPAPQTDTEIPGGLMIAQDGFAFRLADTSARPGRDVPVAFTIDGPDGKPVTAYDVEHEKRLHLIAVRRDFTGFQHVHPTLDDAGTWSIGLDLTPGQWRLFADFTASGAEGLTLGADLSVSGDYVPAEDAGESRTAQVDGYTVTLDGDLTPGSDAKLTLNVERDGRPVTDLQPYLGAYGHLVALREGDLAYLHVHPDGTPGDGSTEPGPDVVFYAAVPSAGDYRLYLDFKHDGVVRTAAFAVGAGGAAAEPTPAEAPGEEPADEHGH
jgi:hypothetical protein